MLPWQSSNPISQKMLCSLEPSPLVDDALLEILSELAD